MSWFNLNQSNYLWIQKKAKIKTRQLASSCLMLAMALGMFCSCQMMGFFPVQTNDVIKKNTKIMHFCLQPLSRLDLQWLVLLSHGSWKSRIDWSCKLLIWSQNSWNLFVYESLKISFSVLFVKSFNGFSNKDLVISASLSFFIWFAPALLFYKEKKPKTISHQNKKTSRPLKLILESLHFFIWFYFIIFIFLIYFLPVFYSLICYFWKAGLLISKLKMLVQYCIHFFN